MAVLNHYLPMHTKTKYESDKPWITDKFKEIIAKRQKAWFSNNVSDFKHYRNLAHRMAKSLRRNFYQSKIQNLRQSDSKLLWRHTNILTGQLTSSPLEAIANELFNGNTTALANGITFQSVSSDLSSLKVNDLLHNSV